MASSDRCPVCGNDLEWDEVDIGVGTARGPAYCPDPDCKFDANNPVCKHGTAMDVHCCNCHYGFLFDADSCTCINTEEQLVADAAEAVEKVDADELEAYADAIRHAEHRDREED